MKKIYTKNNYIIIEYGNIKLMRPKKNIFFIRSLEEGKYYVKDIGQKIPNYLELSLWTDFIDINDQPFASLELFEYFITENTGNFNSGSSGGTIDPQDYDLAEFTNISVDPFVQESDLLNKADLVFGKVPVSQLPSYVDDVLEFSNIASFPANGESGKIYVALNTNLIYRWSGSSYVEISPSNITNFYPKIEILSYDQDTTNYIITIAVSQLTDFITVSNLNSSDLEVIMPSDGINPTSAVSISFSNNQFLGNSIYNNPAPFTLNGYALKILIPKSSNTSLNWNNDESAITVVWKYTDKLDGFNSRVYKPRRFATDTKKIGEIRPKQPLLISGTNIKTFNSVSLLGSGNLVRKNESGQVKVNYTGLSLSNFTSDVLKTFDINVATPTISASPTTKYPNSTPNNYSGFFDSARGVSPIGRLIENPINGQTHIWRIQGTYANKNNNNVGIIELVLRNPVSGFQYYMAINLPEGRTSGNFNIVGFTISDSASIPSPNGYILDAITSFTDNNLLIDIQSITRFSNAIEP
jgi:hypothetical protein